MCAALLLVSLGIAAPAAAAPDWDLVWQSGFEQGFPGGEWHPYNNGSWSPSGAMPAGRVSAWTIVSEASGEPVLAGNAASRAWVTAPAGSNHRPYPALHADDPNNVTEPIATPAVSTWWVWLDCDWAAMGTQQWISLGTWTNNEAWVVHTVSVRDRRLEFAHTDPFAGEWIGPLPRPAFPLRQWVRLTMYLDYHGTDGFVQLWQDGVPVMRADWRLPMPGTDLLRAHWGLYAHPGVASATLYNDELAIWSLSEPLTDLVSEPLPAPEPADGALAAASLATLAAVLASRRARSAARAR
jgi:hypothetical protein